MRARPLAPRAILFALVASTLSAGCSTEVTVIGAADEGSPDGDAAPVVTPSTEPPPVAPSEVVATNSLDCAEHAAVCSWTYCALEVEPPACTGCGEAIGKGSCAERPVCLGASSERLEALLQCACKGTAPFECGNTCFHACLGFEGASVECVACFEERCGWQYAACLEDP